MRLSIPVVALLLAGCGAEPAAPASLASAATFGAAVNVSRSPTVDSTVNLNFGKSIAVDANGVVHAVWLEAGTTVAYARSVDDGVTFSTPIALSPAAAGTGEPKIAAGPSTGSNVYIVWHADYANSGAPHIYMQRSIDGGLVFTASPITDVATIGQAWPSVAAWGSIVSVVWGDHRTGPSSEIYARTSNDGGATWPSAAVPVSIHDGRSSWTPSVAVSQGIVHVAWTDERHDTVDCGLPPANTPCNEEEYYRRSTDGGVTFTEAEIRLTTDPVTPAPSYAPSIVAWGPNVHIVYFDKRSSYWQVFYRRSLTGGASFEAGEQLLSGNTGSDFCARPSIAALDRELHVTWWRETGLPTTDVWYTSSTTLGVAGGWSAPQNLTATLSDVARHPSIAVSPNHHAFVIWYDDRPGLKDVWLKRIVP